MLISVFFGGDDEENGEPAGRGIERDEIEDLFSEPVIGFEFKNAALRNGTPRIMRLAPNE